MSKCLKLSCEFHNGIHARPASFLAEACQKFTSSIKIKRSINSELFNAKSAISVVSANILFNDEFQIEISGIDESQAYEELNNYLTGEWLLCDENKNEQDDVDYNGYLPNIFKESKQKYIEGKPIVAGIAISELKKLKDSSIGSDYFNKVNKGSIQDESDKFNSARNVAVDELKAKLSQADDNERDLIKFQIQFISDEELKVKILCHIYDEYSALEAINKVVGFYVEKFRSSESKYIRQRDVDVIDIGYRLMSYIDNNITEIIKPVVESECILLCSSLTPSQFLSLDKKNIKGLIISNVGETSHTIILAKAYGIPTLIGVDESRFSAAVNTQVVLDTYLGVCVYELHERIQHYYDSELETYGKVEALNKQYTKDKTHTSDNRKVEIAANIINAEECELAFKNGAEAVGLFRTEMMYIDSDTCPAKEEIMSQVNDVLSHTKGRSIIVRTLDIGGDKPAKYIHFDKEANPFLGYRGIRIYQDNYTIFKDLIESLLLAESDDNIKIMVPMVSSLEEVIWFKEHIEEIKSELNVTKKVELGIMIEVPSIAFNLEACCKVVDFFSIGTNDLMQYFMAADRENNRVKYLYNKYNPAFVRFVNHIISTAKNNNTWIGVCGELASDPDFIKLLVGMGVDELSVGCSAVPRVKRLVANLNAKKCEELLEKALKIDESDALSQLVMNTSCDDTAHEIIHCKNIHTGVNFIDKDNAIKFLVDNLYVNDLTKNKYALEEDIWNREKTYSTDIGFGFAIPHTKSNNIEKTSISICKLDIPVKWGEQEVSIIIMLTIKNESDGSNEHMKIFSLLARKIMNSSFRASLSACDTSADIEALMKNNLEE